MSHEFIISIPTKDEIKEKTSAFWTKHKKKVYIGGAVIGTAAIAGIATSLKDDDSDESQQYDPNAIDADPNLELASAPGTIDSYIVDVDEDGEMTAYIETNPSETE